MITIASCPLCSGNRSEPYYQFGAPRRTVVHNRVCLDCGLIFQSPQFDQRELADYYARYMTVTQASLVAIPLSFEDHIRALGRLRLRRLMPVLRDGQKCLDIGCSFGAAMKVLRDESGVALDLVGVNPEEGLARFGRENYGLDIRVGMFEDMDFAPASFDLVILDNVIEHLNSPKDAVAAINRLTRDGGVLFIVTNDARRPHGFLWQNYFADHTVTFTPRTLAAMLEACGYVVESSDSDGHITHLGYHYTYTTCVARKVGAPAAAPSWTALADHAAEMVAFRDGYLRHSYDDDGLRKRLYEWSLDGGPLRASVARWLQAAATRVGRDLTFTVPSHTLPPDEVRTHWAIAAFCDTYDDGAKAIALAGKTEMNAPFYLFRTAPDPVAGQDGPAYLSAIVPPDCGIPRHFADQRQALAWLLEPERGIDLLVALRLRAAPALPDEAAPAVVAHIRSDTDAAMVEFPGLKIVVVRPPQTHDLERSGIDGFSVPPVMARRRGGMA